ncbi:kinase-like domain-containing protein [Chaetomidium leptoderma]|uniref:Kinase-like domain-containing protein n=1 Tax=Chaetomidium leptoderma TaxID=669021 RepID=A0AAN6ZSX2_9PEZI|nr:kinase-like domain-containing protein [Chaetomidium leptoderma]
MDATPQSGDHTRPIDYEIDKARTLANTVILNWLASRLEDDPTADLAQGLKQQADAYPPFRRRLEQAAQEKATAQGSDSDSDSDSESENCSGRASPSNAQLHDFLIEGPVEVTRALDERIMALVGLTECRPVDANPQNATELATQINKAIENGEVLWRLYGTVVLGLGASVVVKIGTSLDPDDVANLRYINAHVPDVPAPLSLGSLKAGRKGYHFMSRADGVTLETLWPDLSVEHKTSIKTQLSSILRALRKGPQPSPDSRHGGMPRFGGFISAVCKDTRRQQWVSAPTIHNETQFNDFLCHKPGRSANAWITMIRSGMRDDHSLVMTHGDLHPRNIMVQWEGGEEEEGARDRGEKKRVRVTALIDWESSGWYPEYWEFVRAVSTINVRGKLSDWFGYLPTEAMGSWPVELSIDSFLDRCLG